MSPWTPLTPPPVSLHRRRLVCYVCKDGGTLFPIPCEGLAPPRLRVQRERVPASESTSPLFASKPPLTRTGPGCETSRLRGLRVGATAPFPSVPLMRVRETQEGSSAIPAYALRGRRDGLPCGRCGEGSHAPRCRLAPPSLPLRNSRRTRPGGDTY